MKYGTSLLAWNSFGVDCRVDAAVDVHSEVELLEVAERFGPDEITVFGGGSNVILRESLPGCAVRISIDGIQVERRDGEILVSAGAGVRWHDLVRFCIGRGLGGLENLALIPGRVGAAPMQNIGAYGVELADVLRSLTAVSLTTGEARQFDPPDCEFGYRDSVFKRRSDLVITSVTLALADQWQAHTGYPDVTDMVTRLGGQMTPTRIAEAIVRIRRHKLPDPRTVGNAGSTFKNPTVSHEKFSELQGVVPGLRGFDSAAGTKIPAARLIEHGGWKGYRERTVGVWQRQPLVLVNLGDASGSEVLGLANRIRDDIAERFDVALELEPQVLGRD